MKPRNRNLVVLGTLVALLAGAVVWGGGKNRSSDRMTFDELVEKLEQGELVSGAEFGPWTLPKPWVDKGRRDSSRVTYGVAVFRDRLRLLSLYVSDGKIYAACLVQARPTWRDKWYFCDEALLATHIRLSTGITDEGAREPEPDTGDR